MTENGKKFWSGFVDSISPDSKNGLMNLTALFILIFSLIFSNIFLIPIDNLKESLGWLLYPVFSIFMYFIIIILFSDDILYQGNPNNKYVRAFQMYWPSKHIANKFDMTQEDASHYWFENYFNKWANPDHPRHDQWNRTLKRGYECRFIYYCIQFLNVLLVISTVSLIFIVIILPILSTIFSITHKIHTLSAIVFIIFIGLLNLLIRQKNNTIPKQFTGVWRRYEEINKMHRKWIDDNITSHEILRNPK